VSETPGTTRSAWTILAVATTAQAASGYVFLGVAAVAGLISDSLGLSGTQTGLIVTAAGLAPLFALLPVGRLLDLYGERRVVALGGLWLAVGVGLAALARSYAVLLLILFVAGAGYATSQPGGSKAVAGWFPGSRRGLAMGIRQTGLPIGGALAAATLPAAAVRWGWKPALAVAAVVAAVGAALFGFVYGEPDLEDDERGRYQVGGELRRLIAAPVIRPALVAGLVMVSTQFCLVSYLIPFLRRELGMTVGRAGFVLAGVQASGVAGRVLLASWSDRLGPGRRMTAVAVAALASLVGVASLPLLSASVPVFVVLALGIVLGFFAFGWYGPWVVHVTELAPARSVGLTLTFAMTANQLGIVAGPPAFGSVLDLWGSYEVAWWTLAGALAIGVAVMVMRRP
jgi:predicted MFS family arabinose efflux permease